MLLRFSVGAPDADQRRRKALALAVAQAPCGVLLIAPTSQHVLPLTEALRLINPDPSVKVTAPAGFPFLERQSYGVVIVADVPGLPSRDHQAILALARRQAAERGAAVLFMVGGVLLGAPTHDPAKEG